MYTLIQGTHLEDLADQAREWMVPQFFHPQSTLIIVQNENVRRWLLLRLADQFGAAGALEIMIPDAALRLLVESLDWAALGRDKPPLLFMDSLKLLLLDKIPAFLASGGSNWDQLRSFVTPEGQPDDRRLFGLVNAIAGSFHYYAHNQAEIPQYWARGEGYPTPLGSEGWQRELWQGCFPSGSGPRILGTLLQELTDRPTPPAFAPGRAWDRILILGSPFLSRQAFGFLHHLSASVEVRHYLYLPAPVVGRTDQPLPEPAAGWSRLSQAFLREARTRGVEPQTLKIPPLTDTTDLLRVKQGLATGTVSRWEGDGSLQFIPCTTRKRELEVLKDRLSLFLRDPALTPQDIAVMAPDMDLYAPLVPAVFGHPGEEEGIPHNLQTSRLPPTSRLDGVLAFLSLGTGRLTRKEVLDFFRHPGVRKTQGLDDQGLAAWEKFLEETSVAWGWDQDHKNRESATDALDDSATWKRAGERLWLTAAFGAQDRPVLLPSGKADWPAATSEPQLMAHLLSLLETLRVTLTSWSGEARTLTQWCRELQSLAELLVGPQDKEEDSRDRDELEIVLMKVQALEEDLAYRDKTWSFSLFQELFSDLAQRQDRGAGGFLVQGLNFFGFSPLRTLPFKVIALLGMDEGTFPGVEAPQAFDLRSREKNDTDLEASHLFTFFETLMAPSQALLLFWRGRDESTGEDRPPALPIQDLLDLVSTAGVDEGSVVLKAPVTPHHPGVFLSGAPLPGTARRHLNAARSLVQSPPHGGVLHRLAVQTLPPLPDLAPRDWTLLLTASLRFVLEKIYRVRYSREEEDREVEDFSLDFFRSREFFQAALTSPEADLLLEKWQTQGRWGNPRLRTWETQDLQAGAQQLAARWASLDHSGSAFQKVSLLSPAREEVVFQVLPQGGVRLVYQVSAALEEKKIHGLEGLKYRLGALMGWIWALAQDLVRPPASLEVVFFNSPKRQMVLWSPESTLFYQPEEARRFVADLQDLLKTMVLQPFPLYPGFFPKKWTPAAPFPGPEQAQEFWEDWEDSALPGQEGTDTPGTCPYLQAGWSGPPPWDDILPPMNSAVQRFWAPFFTPAESPEKETL